MIVNTPAEVTRSCGIANVGIKGMKPALLAETLMNKYKIFTVAIDYANVQGCRITPNLYTTTRELDQFVNALERNGSRCRELTKLNFWKVPHFWKVQGLLESTPTFGKSRDFWKVPPLLESSGAFGNQLNQSR